MQLESCVQCDFRQIKEEQWAFTERSETGKTGVHRWVLWVLAEPRISTGSQVKHGPMRQAPPSAAVMNLGLLFSHQSVGQRFPSQLPVQSFAVLAPRTEGSSSLLPVCAKGCSSSSANRRTVQAGCGKGSLSPCAHPWNSPNPV